MPEALRPEDYAEPRCVLCEEPYGAEPEIRAVPQERIVRKMNEYMARRDYPGAERHLLYWLEEAKLGRDQRGELTIRNELVGHYRKTGEKEKALVQVDEVLRLIKELDFGGTISAGTSFVNAGTALNAFGENARALELFRRAREVYEAVPSVGKELLGGLYNNMGLTHVALGQFPEADALYRKALSLMEQVPGGELEQAITWLNMASAAEAEQGPEEAEQTVSGYLDRAYELLQSSSAPRDGYYAFVLEKCAPSFDYWGRFLESRRLKKQAEEIYRQVSGASK